MQERRHYSKAPITEAIIDFRVVRSSNASLESLNGLFPKIAVDYPHQDQFVLLEGQVTSDPTVGVGAVANQSLVGYVYSSDDRSKVFRAGLDGFTFSRLAPYDRWEPFRDEAEQLWQTYAQEFQIEGVQRTAVRYVNRIDIPLPCVDLKEFFRTIPEVSPDLPQGLNGYFMQLQIPQSDISAVAVINQMMMPPQMPDVISVILDIDIFKEHSLITGHTFWEILE